MDSQSDRQTDNIEACMTRLELNARMLHALHASAWCWFRMCPHTMRLLPYMLAKLNAMPSAQKWLGLRISYGMNGILLRSEDLKSFATYMR